ncbi:hypothetical protein [Halolamina sp.]|uniref:hypothetical protein n=1 Tax=Halolamina sp. TaxID=1940283 RepID=UPI003562BA44
MPSGTLKESDEKYLRAAVMNPDPVVTAVEVADAVGVTQQAAYSKLSGLEERGFIRSKGVGSRAKVWWVTDSGKRAYAESQS